MIVAAQARCANHSSAPETSAFDGRIGGMPIPAQTPAPAAPAAPVEFQSVQVLQTQIADISAQVAGYRAERSALQQQLRSDRVDGGSRPELASRVGELSAKIARGEGEIDRLASQVARLRGVERVQVGPGGILINPPMARRGPDPDMVVGMSFVLAMCLVLPISIAIAKRIWRGKRDTGPIIEERVSQRLDRLEQAVDTIAVEIERISEGQRFVTKVLVERPQANRPQAAAESNEGAALNDAKPFLALGAGPIEPIRMAERQAMRQSITPH
jgi:hypothetical protein